MTRLRVLSGSHAGIFLDWLSTRLVVGASEDLDVFISDWNAQQVELRREPDGSFLACWQDADDKLGVEGEQQLQDGSFVCTLQPWVPVRFGGVILCVGPNDQPWPDDADLLQRCFVPPLPTAANPADAACAAPRPPRRWRLLVSAAACCAAVVVAAPAAMQRAAPEQKSSASVVANGASGPSAAPGQAGAAAALQGAPLVQPAADPVERLRHLTGPQALEGLTLQHSAQQVVVRGVLPSRSAVDELNRLLNALPADLAVSRRFVAQPDVVDRLHESLPSLGLTVRHLQGAQFEVSGTVANPARTGSAIDNIANDLAEFGVELKTVLRSRHETLPTMSGLLIDGNGNSFLRTRDGTKHIVAAAATVAAAEAPAPGAPAPITQMTPMRAHSAGDAR